MFADAPASDYAPQDEIRLPGYLSRVPSVQELLGGPAERWTVSEIGDGNLNLVFVVQGARSSVIVKQALPYVRMVGESWPLPISRSHFEHRALRSYEELCPGLTPAILHHDHRLALTVMEHLRPHVVMRRGIAAGIVYPGFADAVSTFLARTLFMTSDLACGADQKKRQLVTGNVAMSKITEDLVFTEPFYAAANNRWNSPRLDAAVAELRQDIDLILHATRLKYAFLNHLEANIHGDLHTGSIMVSETDTRIIDAEFACTGPMGFDIGALVGNLLMAYCAQRGLEPVPGARDAYGSWLLSTIEEVWRGFHAKFLGLWARGCSGDAFSAALFARPELRGALQVEQRHFLQRVLHDAIGFAGLEMIRRVVGLAHIAEFEIIPDPDVRAACESRALAIGRRLVVAAANFDCMESVTRFAAGSGGMASPAR